MSKRDDILKTAEQLFNRTDINTRIGWYSKRITGDTKAGGASGFAETEAEDADWSGVPLRFSRIQGADCCGRIVAIGEGMASSRIGERVLVRNIEDRDGAAGFHRQALCRQAGAGIPAGEC